MRPFAKSSSYHISSVQFMCCEQGLTNADNSHYHTKFCTHRWRYDHEADDVCSELHACPDFSWSFSGSYLWHFGNKYTSSVFRLAVCGNPVGIFAEIFGVRKLEALDYNCAALFVRPYVPYVLVEHRIMTDRQRQSDGRTRGYNLARQHNAAW